MKKYEVTCPRKWPINLLFVCGRYACNFCHFLVVLCVRSPSYFYGPTAFWSYMFVISKVYELGDTVFIVLRKQPLIFLHWYHHISVMIYVWYSYTDHTSPGRWFMVMNYTVHSFMYTYYAARAMRFRVARWVNIFITSIQISQMVMGLIINMSIYRVKTQGGRYCQQSFENLKYCSLMYLSYFFLFAYFFYITYLQKKKPTESDQKKKEPVLDTAKEIARNLMWCDNFMGKILCTKCIMYGNLIETVNTITVMEKLSYSLKVYDVSCYLVKESFMWNMSKSVSWNKFI